jgi:exonuclease III
MWGNNCILGGDFNSILCDTPGADNLDREGAGRVPNRQNSRAINEWIISGMVLDPFRTLYPHTREFLYIQFRGQNVGNREAPRISKSRLDFFLISPDILDMVNKVKYEDRIGSDFDHKEVTLEIGKKTKGAKITIYDSTLNDAVAMDAVNMVVYESLATNLVHILV